jgi:hypothetical protein
MYLRTFKKMIFCSRLEVSKMLVLETEEVSVMEPTIKIPLFPNLMVAHTWEGAQLHNYQVFTRTLEAKWYQ